VADAEAKKATTIYTLLSVIDEYISSNRYSRDAETRWFAKFMDEDVRPTAQRLRSDGLNDLEKAAVAEFRLTEIKAAKDVKQREIDELDREAKRLSAGAH
jgi:hypothetical protein